MPTGTVRWFDQQKGYGLIRPHGGGKSVFVDISAVQKAGLKTLNDGQTIDYEVVNYRGLESADNLRLKQLRD
jgi:CspA family cold shock protein